MPLFIIMLQATKYIGTALDNLDNIPSHGVVKDALIALGCMEHRRGCGADNDSGPGDGSGLMSSIAWDFFNCTVFSCYKKIS